VYEHYDFYKGETTMRKFFNTVLFVTAILFFVIFALSNTQTIQLSFLTYQLRPVPISLLILLSFLAGLVLGSLLNLLDRMSLKRQVKRLTKDLHQKDGQPKPKDSQVPPPSGDTQQGSGNAL
jgi:uncharacterized integral membrane protein